jgi:hypothetical protein
MGGTAFLFKLSLGTSLKWMRKPSALEISFVIAAQDFDTAADNYGQNQATVIADQANVNRLGGP